MFLEPIFLWHCASDWVVLSSEIKLDFALFFADLCSVILNLIIEKPPDISHRNVEWSSLHLLHIFPGLMHFAAAKS